MVPNGYDVLVLVLLQVPSKPLVTHALARLHAQYTSVYAYTFDCQTPGPRIRSLIRSGFWSTPLDFH